MLWEIFKFCCWEHDVKYKRASMCLNGKKDNLRLTWKWSSGDRNLLILTVTHGKLEGDAENSMNGQEPHVW